MSGQAQLSVRMAAAPSGCAASRSGWFQAQLSVRTVCLLPGACSGWFGCVFGLVVGEGQAQLSLRTVCLLPGACSGWFGCVFGLVVGGGSGPVVAAHGVSPSGCVFGLVRVRVRVGRGGRVRPSCRCACPWLLPAMRSVGVVGVQAQLSVRTVRLLPVGRVGWKQGGSGPVVGTHGGSPSGRTGRVLGARVRPSYRYACPRFLSVLVGCQSGPRGSGWFCRVRDASVAESAS